MKPALPLVVLLLALAGCETSAYWYVSHPEKQTVTIDGSEVYVVPRGPGKFDAWTTSSTESAPILKARQVRAVEEVGHCKVSAAEYAPTSALLQTLCN